MISPFRFTLCLSSLCLCHLDLLSLPQMCSVLHLRAFLNAIPRSWNALPPLCLVNTYLAFSFQFKHHTSSGKLWPLLSKYGHSSRLPWHTLFLQGVFDNPLIEKWGLCSFPLNPGELETVAVERTKEEWGVFGVFFSISWEQQHPIRTTGGQLTPPPAPFSRAAGVDSRLSSGQWGHSTHPHLPQWMAQEWTCDPVRANETQVQQQKGNSD